MLIHGFPLTSSDLRSDGRFWYWRGATGRHYIHSVYPVAACPPLPGAVYVAVRRTGTMRTALEIGRLPVLWDLAASVAQRLTVLGADEIHVHLLAGNDGEARTICADLVSALNGNAPGEHPVPRAVGLAA